MSSPTPPQDTSLENPTSHDVASKTDDPEDLTKASTDDSEETPSQQSEPITENVVTDQKDDEEALDMSIGKKYQVELMEVSEEVSDSREEEFKINETTEDVETKEVKSDEQKSGKEETTTEKEIPNADGEITDKTQDAGKNTEPEKTNEVEDKVETEKSTEREAESEESKEENKTAEKTEKEKNKEKDTVSGEVAEETKCVGDMSSEKAETEKDAKNEDEKTAEEPKEDKTGEQAKAEEATKTDDEKTSEEVKEENTSEKAKGSEEQKTTEKDKAEEDKAAENTKMEVDTATEDKTDESSNTKAETGESAEEPMEVDGEEPAAKKSKTEDGDAKTEEPLALDHAATLVKKEVSAAIKVYQKYFDDMKLAQKVTQPNISNYIRGVILKRLNSNTIHIDGYLARIEKARTKEEFQTLYDEITLLIKKARQSQEINELLGPLY